MRILLGIGHPAHVHYFKNFIKIMEQKGHEFLIIAKNRNIVFRLLEDNNIPYIPRKDYPKSLLGKLIRVPLTDLLFVKHVLRFKADLLLGFAGTFQAHAAFLTRKPCVIFDDTDHSTLAHASYLPFIKTVLTPKCFMKDFGSKQIRFDGYMELCYLHPNYFKPDDSVLSYLGISKEEKFCIVRFVAWKASHDAGFNGVSLKSKIKIINELKKSYKVFISSEDELPQELEAYKIMIPPEKMHDALFFAQMFVGEGATMASECAMLGTPSIYLNPLEVGTCKEQENVYNACVNFRDDQGVIRKLKEMVSNKNLKKEFKNNSAKMISEKIDVTAFMVWFVENYPQSDEIMKKQPEYQIKFLK